MAYDTLKLDLRDGVARITLGRPDAAHAMNLPMARELMRASIDLDEDPSVRAVLVASTGRIFCAGGDLASFRDAGDSLPALLKEITVYLHGAISRFARMRAPVIAAVNGAAAGAGFSLVCATDLALAAESARFSMAYTRAGLTPDGSSTYFLPRLIGTRRTLELMLTNRTLSAGEALEWGLVNRVVPDAELEATATAVAHQLAAGPTGAFGAVKRLVENSTRDSLESQMEHEARAIADAARSADAQEGMQAFFAKRAPVFQGR
jgi:2-(1,2-epoxy-1,2-dihydrophenyl)acetyl-CoA isomerase